MFGVTSGVLGAASMMSEGTSGVIGDIRDLGVTLGVLADFRGVG